MHEFLLSFLVFFLSSVISVIFTLFAVAPSTIHKIIGILILPVFLLIYGYKLHRIKTFIQKDWGKWWILFLFALLTQLIIVSTGGIYSRFFILLHLFTLACSFFFSFQIALVFLVFIVIVLGVNTLFSPVLLSSFVTDPVTPLAYFISFFSMLPLAYLLSERYHLKDKLANMLSSQIAVEETILESLHEIVIVTDTSYRILSVNEAAERALHRSRVELINVPLFSVLYVKDKNGNLLKENALSLAAISEKAKKGMALTMQDLLLLSTGAGPTKVSLQVKPIADIEGKITQISFIISDAVQKEEVHKDLELATTKHQAMIENLKQLLRRENLFALNTKLSLIAKAEQDIFTARLIEDHPVVEKKVRIDIARLCQSLLKGEKELADAFHVLLDFSFINFGKNDIESLIAHAKFALSYQQLTGPFFTVSCDVKQISIVLQKLIEISILLASSEVRPFVKASIARDGNAALIVTITASCPPIIPEQEGDLFVRYYGRLSDRTNLRIGSGLEGYLAKTITGQLNIPLSVEIVEDSGMVIFSLRIPKDTPPTA